MILLTVTEYLCHKWPRIRSVCRNPVISSFMTYHRVCNKSSTTGVTCEKGTAYSSGAPELSSSSVFNGIRVARSLVFCAMFYGSLFVLLSFFIWPICCLSFFSLRLLITLWYFQTVASSVSVRLGLLLVSIVTFNN